MLLCADKDNLLLLSGSGEVIDGGGRGNEEFDGHAGGDFIIEADQLHDTVGIFRKEAQALDVAGGSGTDDEGELIDGVVDEGDDKVAIIVGGNALEEGVARVALGALLSLFSLRTLLALRALRTLRAGCALFTLRTLGTRCSGPAG